MSTGHFPFPDADTPRRRCWHISSRGHFGLGRIAVAQRLCGAVKEDDPVIFGGAGGGNGGAGATSGVSVSFGRRLGGVQDRRFLLGVQRSRKVKLGARVKNSHADHRTEVTGKSEAAVL